MAAAIAVLAVIGISATATVLIAGDRDSHAATTGPTPASAGDTSPVTVITIEPTCDAHGPINNPFAELAASGGWGSARKDLGPRDQWTPAQTSQVDAIIATMRTAADRLVALAIQTPHRWIRELYEVQIAYYRAYADKTATYTPADNALASAGVNASNAITRLCQAITDGSASRAITTPPAPKPVSIAPQHNPADAPRFITSTDPLCGPWQAAYDTFMASTTDWRQLDDSTPAAQWTPEQRALNQTGLAVVDTWAQQMNNAAAATTNPVLQDFVYATALYLTTYTAVGDSYVQADKWLLNTAYALNQTILGGCNSAKS